MVCRTSRISPVFCADEGIAPEEPEKHQGHAYHRYDSGAEYMGDWLEGKRHGRGWASLGKAKYVG